MPLDQNVFDNPPECNTKLNALLNFNQKKVDKNR